MARRNPYAQIQREQQRQLRAAIKAQEKADKEAYIERREEEAEELTEELLSKFEEYIEDLEGAFCSDPFKAKKATFVKEPFTYGKVHPYKIDPSLDFEPNESWLERFFPAKREKRLSIIEKNNEKKRAADEEYAAKVKEYEAEKQKAMDEWDEEQTHLAEEFYSKIEAERKLYIEKQPVGLERYVQYLFEDSRFGGEIIDGHAVGYQPQLGKVVLEIYMRPKDEIFFAEGYRYMKQKDEIVPVKMKVTTANTKMKSLIQTVALAATELLYYNDTESVIDDLVVNVYSEDVCCISVQVERETYFKYTLNDRTQKVAFLNRHVRQAKTFSTGVTAFEYLYQVE